DALIDDPASVAEHDRLLAPLAPLLRDADLTAVNVESPISEQPYIDPTRPRQPGVHPTKEFVFASGTGMPAALADAGVDVVGLANNHQFDLLSGGVRSTVDAFAGAGFAPGSGQFGLGATVEEAYRPAITEVSGMRVAFLGCTTITGAEHAINYVAGPDKAGAAPCEETRIRDGVAAAASAADLVVFGVHGGFEYGREPSSTVQRLTATARAAGAQLVINHHPHVVGGLDWDGRSLAAWSLGNLVFDQTVWPTFQSYVLVVHVRRDEVVRAYLEPVMVEDYVARGVGSRLADHVARAAAGLSRGPFVLEDGAVELDLDDRIAEDAQVVQLSGSPTGTITEIAAGWRLDRVDPASGQCGTDLMWVGDFDGPVVSAGAGALWSTEPDARAVLAPAPDYGGVFRLRRTDDNSEAVVASPLHRMLLTNPGSVALRRARSELDGEAVPPLRPGGPRAQAQLSLTGSLRAGPGATVEVQISWYPDTRGPSSAQTVQVFDEGSQ
ncbi:MAG: CapA family protein, partial [Actinomycetes bacterium]